MGLFSGMEISSTCGMKKFYNLKTMAHLEIVFLYELTKQYFYFKMPFFIYIIVRMLREFNMQHFHDFFPLPTLRMQKRENSKNKNQFFRENVVCR